MHGNDCFGVRCDCSFDLCFVNIHGIRPDIDKNRYGTAQNHCVCGAGKGIAWKDDLITLLKIAKDCSHIKRTGTACRQKNVLCMKALLHPCAAALGEFSVAGNPLLFDCVSDVIHFVADDRRHIETNHNTPFYKRYRESV